MLMPLRSSEYTPNPRAIGSKPDRPLWRAILGSRTSSWKSGRRKLQTSPCLLQGSIQSIQKKMLRAHYGLYSLHAERRSFLAGLQLPGRVLLCGRVPGKIVLHWDGQEEEKYEEKSWEVVEGAIQWGRGGRQAEGVAVRRHDPVGFGEDDISGVVIGGGEEILLRSTRMEQWR